MSEYTNYKNDKEPDSTQVLKIQTVPGVESGSLTSLRCKLDATVYKNIHRVNFIDIDFVSLYA